MASASMLISRSQFCPSNFLRKGVMLFDLAQTSKVSTRKLERLYASCDLRKTPPSVWKKTSQTTKRQVCAFSFAPLPPRAEPPFPYVRIFQIHLKLKRSV